MLSVDRRQTTVFLGFFAQVCDCLNCSCFGKEILDRIYNLLSGSDGIAADEFLNDSEIKDFQRSLMEDYEQRNMITSTISSLSNSEDIMAIMDSPGQHLRLETKNTLECTQNGQDYTDLTAIFESGVFKDSHVID